MALAVAASTGCSSSGDGHWTTSSESVGNVEVALSATGPDGATYSLPPSTMLYMAGSAIIAGPHLDAPTATQSFSVPSGNYQVTLMGGNDAGTFTLNREADGGATTVTANLVDPQPRTVTVTAGQTTPIVFHFVIPEVGNVTFSEGMVTASVQVDAGGIAATGAVVSGPLLFQTDVLGNNTAVNGLFTPWDSPTESISLTLPFTGGWMASLDSVCTHGTAAVTATPSVSSPTDANVAAFLSEVDGAGFDLCLFDANAGGATYLTIERTGLPVSPAFLGALGANAYFTLFSFSLVFQPPAPLFDGTTAYIGQFAQPQPLPATVNAYVSTGTADPVKFSSSQTSTLSVQFTP
jgi:hypothetical protein